MNSALLVHSFLFTSSVGLFFTSVVMIYMHFHSFYNSIIPVDVWLSGVL